MHYDVKINSYEQLYSDTDELLVNY